MRFLKASPSICYTYFYMSIIIILIMLVLNALLAAYEMALASVSRTKLSILAQEKKYGAESALYMKDHMEGSLATIQIGITLVGAGAAAVGGAGADEWFAPWLQANFHLPLRLANALAVILVVLPLSFITIVFGELTPKTFALKNKEWVTLKFSPCMRHLYRFLYPIVRIMEAIVAMLTKKTMRKNIDPKEAQKAAMADLRAAVSIASSSRLFGKAEEKIVLASASFCTRKIKEIQVPLDQVYMLYAGDTIADTFIKAHLDMHTRFPVYEKLEDPQSIIGYLNFKDIFSATKTAAQGVTPTTRSILRPILRLDEDTIISAASEKMMKDHQHICLVTDDDKITGILTLEDIFEELVGEIEDEYDFFQAYIRPFGDALIVSATALMANVFKELGLPAPADLPPNITAEKWAEQQAGHPLGSSEAITACGLRMAVRKFRRHKLMEVLVSKL